MACVPPGLLLLCGGMDVKLRYRGRSLTEADIAFIRRLMAAHPQASRRELSKKLCEAWQWRQPNGTFCDMVCRGLMLKLDRLGHIELPAVRQLNPNPLARRAAERKDRLRCSSIPRRCAPLWVSFGPFSSAKSDTAGRSRSLIV